MQRGGTEAASASESRRATGKASRPDVAAVSALARRSVVTSPTTMQPAIASGSSANALAMISGPMPAASPMVMSKGLLEFEGVMRDCRYR